MEDKEDIQLKKELDEISQRIDDTLKKIETVFESNSEMSGQEND